jgi:hypothetical protein
MPAGDVFGLDGIFLTKSNPVVVSAIGINSTGVGAGITVTAGSFSSGTVTLTLSTAAGLSTTPFYTGTKIAVSGLAIASGAAHTGYNGTFNVTGFAGTTTVSYASTGYVGGVTANITGQTGLVMLVTDTQVTNTTWSSAQTHGWFGGGVAPSTTTVSTVDRIDFSNDTGTANIKGPLSAGKYGVAATGNSNYGWFGGGAPGPLSTVNRIDFSNDLASVSIRSQLSLAKGALAATGNSNYGWFGGGYLPGAVPIPSRQQSTVDRIDFSNDSGTALARSPLSTGRQGLAATGNSNYGWWGGGRNPSPTSVAIVDRIDFSNDFTTASPRSPLSSARGYIAATGNSNYGWFGGGGTGASITSLSTIDRLDFSNDLASVSVRSPLNGRFALSATGNSNYGWFGGGAPAPGASAQVSIIDRIDFSNDSTLVSPRGPLSLARSTTAATSGQARSSSTRLQKAGNYGWFGGGFIVATVDRINFSNDLSTASPRGPLSTFRYNLAATGNSNYGWFGCSAPGPVSTVDRIDFSNDSATALVRGLLSLQRDQHAATGNSNYGWFGGGLAGVSVTTVDRINFSNDLATASPRGSLTSPARNSLAATGNSNYGWFGGGAPGPVATVDRINFSNDLATASPRGPLSSTRSNLVATGNSNYGWFGGGAPGTQSTVDRIDFSNDSATASLRGSLVAPGRIGSAAVGNSNYGWFGGGTPGTISSIVNRIDFSNDSATASIRGSLSSPGRSLHAATSNSTR